VTVNAQWNQNFMNSIEGLDGTYQQDNSLLEAAVMGNEGEFPGGSGTGPGGISGVSGNIAQAANQVLEGEGSSLGQLEYDISGGPENAAIAAGQYVPPIGPSSTNSYRGYA
jgi:hypothetical protein